MPGALVPEGPRQQAVVGPCFILVVMDFDPGPGNAGSGGGNLVGRAALL